MNVPNDYLTIRQAAEILGVHQRTVRRRISDGSLPAYRLGPQLIRIRPDDLARLGRRIPAGGAA
ncbi:MAG: helix-turn-helix domain-containing protein [Candidatus Nanopelagicales bacterium]